MLIIKIIKKISASLSLFLVWLYLLISFLRLIFFGSCFDEWLLLLAASACLLAVVTLINLCCIINTYNKKEPKPNANFSRRSDQNEN